MRELIILWFLSIAFGAAIEFDLKWMKFLPMFLIIILISSPWWSMKLIERFRKKERKGLKCY